MSVQADYEKLGKKYKKMPDWKWLNSNFKIKVEDEEDFLREIKAAVSEKIDHAARAIIEPIISGGEGYCCFFERQMLSNDDRDALFEIYKELMHLLWVSNSLAVNWSEKEGAEWLGEVKNVWSKNAPRLEKISNQIASGWKNYKKKHVETAYHG